MAVTAEYLAPAIDPALVIAGFKVAAETAGAEALLAASQPLVPVESGDLKASGKVEHGPDGASVTYSATNEADGFNYASRIHERDDLHHPNGGQSHFLADPMRTASAAIAAAIAAEIRL